MVQRGLLVHRYVERRRRAVRGQREPESRSRDTAILDTILEDYVEESRSAEQIAESHSYDLDLVKRVIHMIVGSEYKRQQAAPGIKITPKAFGYGRRFPIAAKAEI